MKPDENKRRHITVVGRSGMSEVNWDDIQNKPDFAEVATSGEYDDLENKPTIPTVPAMAIEELTFTLEGGTTKTIEFYTVPNYFYVENLDNTNHNLFITKNNANAPTIEVFKSTDKINWESMGTTSTTAIQATVPANGKLYLKSTTNSWAGGLSLQNMINPGGRSKVGGNIMSLLYGDNFTGKTSFPAESSYNFYGLFKAYNAIIDASNLELPATTLTQGCYQNMFYRSLSLTTPPVLPATTLAQGCYSNMFYQCTSLTTAPELPATTLTNYCYSNMFSSCTALTTAPVLPATSVVESCYQQMFQGCTLLNKVTTYLTTISQHRYLNNWLNGVSATGDFYNLGGATFQSGTSGIPSGWTEHTSL